MTLTVGSLFAGIGGFDLAAERADMEMVWQSEIDVHASRVLDHHWPHVKNLGDIHGITEPPNVDVLTGGFPCQDYSVAGKGAGLAGDRGALWWQFHRVIDLVRPTWVVGENVHGLTTNAHRASLQTIIGSLVRLGYGVVWRVLDAQYFGVAQRRRRVFIVGHSGGQPRPEILALAQGVSGDTPPSREAGEVSTALTETSAGGSGLDDQAVGHLIAMNLRGRDGGAVPEMDYLASLRAAAGGSSRSYVAFAQNTRDEVRELGTLAGALNLPGTKQTTYLATSTVRRLTPLECERLQGFPDGWTATPGNSDSQRYKQLGNAVAVPVAEWIMRQIAEAT